MLVQFNHMSALSLHCFFSFVMPPFISILCLSPSLLFVSGGMFSSLHCPLPLLFFVDVFFPLHPPSIPLSSPLSSHLHSSSTPLSSPLLFLFPLLFCLNPVTLYPPSAPDEWNLVGYLCTHHQRVSSYFLWQPMLKHGKLHINIWFP